MECMNLCKYSARTCEHCKKNYDVSSEFYRAKRTVNDSWVIGYLVKNKAGEIQGILNKSNCFQELAWIDESTLEKVNQQ